MKRPVSVSVVCVSQNFTDKDGIYHNHFIEIGKVYNFIFNSDKKYFKDYNGHVTPGNYWCSVVNQSDTDLVDTFEIEKRNDIGIPIHECYSILIEERNNKINEILK